MVDDRALRLQVTFKSGKFLQLGGGSSGDMFTGIADLSIDPARREVRVGEDLIEIRTKEFDLLQAFAENQGIVLSRERLLDLAWGYDFYGQTRTVDVCELRSPARPEYPVPAVAGARRPGGRRRGSVR